MAWLKLFHCKADSQVKVSGPSPSKGPPPTHSTLTETFGGPVTPLGAASLTIMAGEDGTPRQHKTLVTDILHSCPHRKLGAGYKASAVFHIPWVVAGCHYGWRGKEESREDSVSEGKSALEACMKPWIDRTVLHKPGLVVHACNALQKVLDVIPVLRKWR